MIKATVAYKVKLEKLHTVVHPVPDEQLFKKVDNAHQALLVMIAGE